MPGALVPGLPPTSGLSHAKERFAQLVASGTGLDLNVVRAWVLAEDTSVGNPLGIKPPGGLANFGSPEAAAAATVALLHTDTYKPILRSASGPPLAQIAAISASKWDSNRYRGAGQPASVPAGTLLRGTYATVTHSGTAGSLSLVGGIGGAVSGAAGSVAGAAGDIWGGVTGIPEAIQAGVKDTESWITHGAVVALGYVTLTTLALMLIGLAFWRMAGPTIQGARSAAAGARPKMGIPF